LIRSIAFMSVSKNDHSGREAHLSRRVTRQSSTARCSAALMRLHFAISSIVR
jgi:hypothetical protein